LRLLVDLDPGENFPWELVIDAPDTASARSRRRSMIVWDRGRWKPEGDPQKGLGKGHLAFTLEPICRPLC
jgi:hypothetical protein